VFHAETTDKLLVFGSNGRFYTLSAANLPGGRGMGEPVRLMVDLPNEAEIVALFVHRPAQAADGLSAGDGFVVAEDEIVAQTRAGKQVLNVRDGVTARVCKPVAGRHVAVVGENRKVLVFPLDEAARNGARQGRAAAEIQGWRAVGCAHLHAGRRAQLARPGRPHPDRGRPCRMDRQTRRRRPHGAARLPAGTTASPDPVASIKTTVVRPGTQPGAKVSSAQ
jgi:DNA gyrase/topoisomerase IV subunit A